jgi:hypothetical protein
MVLHRIANPGPPGLAGSIPALGVYDKNRLQLKKKAMLNNIREYTP